jgi:hypothetical protein
MKPLLHEHFSVINIVSTYTIDVYEKIISKVILVTG